MSGRMQELLIVFNREQQTFMVYRGMPWEAEGEEIQAAQRAAEKAGAAHRLRLDGPNEIRRPVAEPHAVLFFQWGYPGRVAIFLSEEPLTWSEQAIVAEALTVARGWSSGEWWQGNHRLPLLESDAPQPFTTYSLLPAVACPARHPPAVLAAGRCDHCEAAVRRYGVWPTQCSLCWGDRKQALHLMEQQGYICPVCLPMQQDRIGQPREARTRPSDAPGA